MSTSADSEKEYRGIRKILEVFQICDSTFPIGTFNHSYGMETYLRDGIVDSNEPSRNGYPFTCGPSSNGAKAWR